MKRTILFALMIPLLLTGCGAQRDAENWKAFAEAVETAERVSFHAEITALREDTSVSFGADIAWRIASDTVSPRPFDADTPLWQLLRIDMGKTDHTMLQ